FILPVSVVKKCESILRYFLWFGFGDAKKTRKVAWSKLCHPNDEGGLGIKSLREWNKVAIMQLGWDIVTRKDTLWVRWSNQVLLKNKCFWEAKISVASSWSWRSVLRLRECLASKLVFNIGDGRNTSLCLDPWLYGQPLISRYGGRVVYDAGIPLEAKVSAVIVNRRWVWPWNSWDLSEIQSRARRIGIGQGPDVIHWVDKGKTFCVAGGTAFPSKGRLDRHCVVPGLHSQA
ncbi:hypothetical protein CFOL_v3_26030, partial [Cephalotus follicularis]